MDPEIVQKLIDLNKVFYQTFGEAFAHTRKRIQPGVRRILEEIPKGGDWMDLGCGSGALALEWISQDRQGSYTGLDFSEVLLAEARESVKKAAAHPKLKIEFQHANIASQDWNFKGAEGCFDGILAFAVLHHIAGFAQREELLRKVHALLKSSGMFIHSEWQFQNSAKWLARRQPWSRIGLEETKLDAGDTLLDWKHALPGQLEKTGLRFVHLFTHEELGKLAEATGFEITNEFESDGEGGRLGLYQTWCKAGR